MGDIKNDNHPWKDVNKMTVKEFNKFGWFKFDTTRNNITMHIKNIFEEGELQENSVSKESLLTASGGKNLVWMHLIKAK